METVDASEVMIKRGVENGGGGAAGSPKDVGGAGGGVPGTPGGTQGGVVYLGKDVQLTSGAYAQREASLMASEEAGEIEFVACTNDGTQDAIRWLIGLKNIYSKQLPNMPREYIARLVLDRNHRSVALVRRAREGRMCWAEPVGGITYRRFGPQGLGEISFCAITADEQVKGFGTRLMNHVKEFAKTDGMEFFLTYADNNAVGYFKKQGFTKEISMPEARWKGYIKDYDGGTLMECLLHPGIDYTRIPQAVAAQRERVEAAVREKTNSHVVREGLDAEFAAARMKRRRVTAEGGGGGDGHAEPAHACLDPMSIPGVREAGWEPPKGLGSRVEYQGGVRKLIQDSFAALRSHKDAWPFEDSIEVLRSIPGYSTHVRNPINLPMIAERLEAGDQYYRTLEIFLADVKRMLDNCMAFNAQDSEYYRIAMRIKTDFESSIRVGLSRPTRGDPSNP